MLAIVIIVRKIEALASPCGYWFNSCIIAIASWINAVIIGSHFLLSSLTSSMASPPSLCLYYNTSPCYTWESFPCFYNKKQPTNLDELHPKNWTQFLGCSSILISHSKYCIFHLVDLQWCREGGGAFAHRLFSLC